MPSLAYQSLAHALNVAAVALGRGPALAPLGVTPAPTPALRGPRGLDHPRASSMPGGLCSALLAVLGRSLEGGGLDALPLQELARSGRQALPECSAG